MGLEIVQKLEALGLGVYAGEPKTLFLDELPDTPPECGAVFESGGAPPDGGFGVAGIQYENPTVAIWFRGLPHDSGPPQAKARTAYLELPKIQAESLSVGGVLYLTITPLQPPFILKRDAQARPIWAFNVLAKKEPS